MAKELSALHELVEDLRSLTGLSQEKLGSIAGASRDSVARYEGGLSMPPIGFVASVARVVWQRRPAAMQRPEDAAHLLKEVNTAIISVLGRTRALASWEDLNALAEQWVQEWQSKHALQKKGGQPSGALWQLRAATSDFVGREQERERLVAALQSGGTDAPQATLACIRGLGGAGKTELAYRVAQELVGNFPDGQLLIELAGSRDLPLRPEDALARAIRAFLPQEQLPEGLAELRARYRSALHSRRVLIVADDARDAAQVRELLPPAGSTLLITSRWRFALAGLVEANVIELGELERDEAVSLLLDLCPHIGAAAPELATLCGSLPLALRIAGGRLASDRTLRVENFMAQLRDERSRLAALEGDDAEHSVAAVLNLSYQALEPAAQSMLAQLSIFPASFSRDAIPGVVLLDGAPASSLDESLSQLYRAGLVELDTEGERVWLHDLVRAFAAQHHHEHDELRRRLAATYGAAMHRLNGAVGRGGAETLLPALAFFDSERANIELGLRWAIEHADEPESAQILVDYVAGMPAVGVFRCHPTQVLRPLYTAGLRLARRLYEPLLELVTLNNLGVIESNLGNEAAAEELFTRGQALALEAAPNEERFGLLFQHNLAKSYLNLGDFERARSTAEALLQSATAKQRSESQIRVLLILGMIERRSDRFERAVQYGEEALSIARSSGNRYLERLVLVNLANAVAALPAMTEKSSNLYGRAVGYATDALAIAEQFDDKPGQINALTVLGNAATLHGDPQVAIERQQEALAVASAQGYDHQVATVLVNLGDAYRALREGEQAAAAYEQGVRAYEPLNDPYSLARAYWRYGDLVVHLHEFAGTAPTLEQAKRAARLWERAVELEQAHKLPTAQEHAATLGKLQGWIAVREQEDGE